MHVQCSRRRHAIVAQNRIDVLVLVFGGRRRVLTFVYEAATGMRTGNARVGLRLHAGGNSDGGG